MEDGSRILKILESLDLKLIIPVIEQGLELEKLEYLATKNPETRCRIADTCVLLSYLYFYVHCQE